MTRRIEVEVYEDDGTTLVDTLTSDNKREFLKDLSAEGSYSFEIKKDHADEPALTDGRIVRFVVDTVAKWQGLVESRGLVYADPNNREAGRVVKYSGRGTLAILERAPIGPQLGLGVVSPAERYFNPASTYFDVSGWGTATAFHTQDTTDDTDPYYSNPAGFKDGGAYWIGPSDGVTSLPAPLGFWWVVKDFTIPTGEGGDHRLSWAVDDGVEWFLDGAKVAGESKVGLWGVTSQQSFLLDEGTHRLAARVENFDRPNASTNATALVASLAKELAGGRTLDDPIVSTDSTWKFLQVTTVEPGMTVGKILHILLTEAQAAGYLTGLTWDFDADDDSNGTPWPIEIDVVFPVGTTLLEVIRHFVDEHAADFEMSATGLVLHAYVSKGADLSGSVEIEYAVNVGRLGFSKTPPGPNTVLARTAEGRWVEYERSSSVSAWGRRGAHLSLGSAPSADAAERQVEAFFDDNAEPTEALTDVQVEEVNVVPLDDFDVGDTVSATTSDGSMGDVRCHAVRCTEDNASNPIWQPEMVAA